MSVSTMSQRERYIACQLGQEVDRPPFILWWGPWSTTWRRWQQEGMPSSCEKWSDVIRHFGTETKWAFPPIHQGPWPAHPEAGQRSAQGDGTYLYRDNWGILRKGLEDSDTMDAFLDFPVKNHGEWEQYKANHLDPDAPGRVPDDLAEWSRLPHVQDAVVTLGCFPDVGIYGGLRWLVGDEEACLLFYDDPALVREIMQHLTDLYLSVWERVTAQGIRVDYIHIWEDMCSKQGPLVGPEHWRSFMGPCYTRIADFAKAHDIPLVSVDTDGQPDLIIPPMIEHGVNGLLPFEVAAGNDINRVQDRYPDLGLIGGIDKRELAKDAAAIDAELERIWPAVEKGRYISALDYGIPNDVSWQNIVHYVERKREMIVNRGERK